MRYYRIGESEKSGSWGFLDYVPFILGGGLLAYGLYKLLEPKKVGESIAPIAPKQAPSKYADFKAVSDRFIQVKELWHMGYIDNTQVITELKTLQEESLLKAANSQATRAEADNLIAQMQSFSNDVGYDLLAKRLTGNNFRVINRI
jgi:hypothetical protein